MKDLAHSAQQPAIAAGLAAGSVVKHGSADGCADRTLPMMRMGVRRGAMGHIHQHSAAAEDEASELASWLGASYDIRSSTASGKIALVRLLQL